MTAISQVQLIGLQCCSDQDQETIFLYINISVKLACKLRSMADVKRLQIDSFLQMNTDPVQIWPQLFKGRITLSGG